MSQDKKTAGEILDPNELTVEYGQKEYKIKHLSIKSLLRLTRIIGGRFGKVYDTFLKEDLTNGQKVEEIMDSLSEEEIIEIISLALDISADEVSSGFRALDAIRVIRVVFEQEDVGKIFFEVLRIRQVINPSN